MPATLFCYPFKTCASQDSCISCCSVGTSNLCASNVTNWKKAQQCQTASSLQLGKMASCIEQAVGGNTIDVGPHAESKNKARLSGTRALNLLVSTWCVVVACNLLERRRRGGCRERLHGAGRSGSLLLPPPPLQLLSHCCKPHQRLQNYVLALPHPHQLRQLLLCLRGSGGGQG